MVHFPFLRLLCNMKGSVWICFLLGIFGSSIPQQEGWFGAVLASKGAHFLWSSPIFGMVCYIISGQIGSAASR